MAGGVCFHLMDGKTRTGSRVCDLRHVMARSEAKEGGGEGRALAEQATEGDGRYAGGSMRSVSVCVFSGLDCLEAALRSGDVAKSMICRRRHASMRRHQLYRPAASYVVVSYVPE